MWIILQSVIYSSLSDRDQTLCESFCSLSFILRRQTGTRRYVNHTAVCHLFFVVRQGPDAMWIILQSVIYSSSSDGDQTLCESYCSLSFIFRCQTGTRRYVNQTVVCHLCFLVSRGPDAMWIRLQSVIYSSVLLDVYHSLTFLKNICLVFIW